MSGLKNQSLRCTKNIVNNFKYIIYSLLSAFFIMMISTQYHLSYAEENVMTVYKSSSCGCCKKWISHIEKNGFTVKTINTNDINGIKNQKNINPKLRSCHTAIINDYIVEGHVPAQEIKKLLAEKRPVAGIAVPNMPIGSPGMEMGAHKSHYAVYEFDEQGRTRLIAKY
jgi:hypothetical protein